MKPRRDWPAILKDATERGLNPVGLARELGVHNSLIYQQEKKFGVKLPRRVEVAEPTTVELYVPDGTEQWRVVRDFPAFEVSSQGRIRRVKNGSPVRFTWHATKYWYASLYAYRPRRSAWKGVHRWVALAFISNPAGLPQVNHKDRVRTNNAVENLEWMTRLDNFAHGRADGNDLAKVNPRVRCKLSPEAVEDIRRQRPVVKKKWANGKITRELAQKYGIGERYVHHIWTGAKRASG